MTALSIPQKRCSKCGDTKPLTEFYKHNGCKDGLRPDCKDCTYISKGKVRPTPTPNGMKWCSRCNTFLPATNEFFFSKNSTRLLSICRTCRRDTLTKTRRDPIKGKRLREMERIRSHQRREIDNDFADRKRARARRNYHKSKLNPEWHKKQQQRIREIQRKRRLTSKVIEQEKQYAQSERGRAVSAMSRLRRRDKKNNSPFHYTKTNWNVCLEYFHYSCAYCGKQRDLFHPLEAEHFIALATKDTPGTIRSNIVPACRYCNASKANRPADEWLVEKLGKRKAKQKLAEIKAYFEWVRNQK